MSDLADHERRLIDELRAFSRDVLTVTGTPGLSIAVSLNGRIIWEAGVGFADLASRRAMTAASVTRASSITKTYTTIAVLKLAEEGLLDLYAPVVRYLPELAIANPFGPREVTIYDLLTFRSGLSADACRCSPSLPASLVETLTDAYERPNTTEYGGVFPRWCAPVGARFRYSNLGIATLGYLVEQVSEEDLSFSDYVQQHILDPLGLESTALPSVAEPPWISRDLRARLTTGHSGLGSLTVCSPLLHPAEYPSCGLLTTASDHLRLLTALANDGELDGARLLRPQTVRFMRSPQVEIGGLGWPSEWFAGVGLQLGNLHSRRYCFGYDGVMFLGWSGEGRVYPHLGLGIVVFTNKMDLLNWQNPAVRTAAGLVVDFAASLVDRQHKPDAERSRRSLAWRRSYAAGLLLAEHVMGLLGVEDPASALRNADPISGFSADVANERGPFQAALNDVMRHGATPDEIRAFLQSADCQVTAEQLPLLAIGLGAATGFPVLAPFWPETDHEGCN